MVGSIGLRQPVAGIRQSDAGGGGRRGGFIQPRAGIGHRDRHPVAGQICIDGDVGTFFLRRHRIFDRILDDRLQPRLCAF